MHQLWRSRRISIGAPQMRLCLNCPINSVVAAYLSFDFVLQHGAFMLRGKSCASLQSPAECDQLSRPARSATGVPRLPSFKLNIAHMLLRLPFVGLPSQKEPWPKDGRASGASRYNKIQPNACMVRWKFARWRKMDCWRELATVTIMVFVDVTLHL